MPWRKASHRADLATSLVAPASATATPDASGFIQRWLLLEPIPCSGLVTQNAVQSIVKKEYFPDQFTFIPKDGDKVSVGNGEYIWHAVDTKHYNVNLYQFAKIWAKPTSNQLFLGRHHCQLPGGHAQRAPGHWLQRRLGLVGSTARKSLASMATVRRSLTTAFPNASP